MEESKINVAKIHKEASFKIEIKESTNLSVYAEILFFNNNTKKSIIISLIDNSAKPKEEKQPKLKDITTDIEKLKNDIAESQNFISNFGNFSLYFSIPVDNIRTAHYKSLTDAIKSIK